MEGDTKHYGSIGWLIGHLRAGHRMRHASWHKDTYLVFVPKDQSNLPHKMAGGASMTAYIALVVPDGTSTPWTATPADLLSTEWQMKEAPQPGHTSAP